MKVKNNLKNQMCNWAKSLYKNSSRTFFYDYKNCLYI